MYIHNKIHIIFLILECVATSSWLLGVWVVDRVCPDFAGAFARGCAVGIRLA